MASVAVLGAAGYAGAVAAALLHRHPELELEHVTARSDAGARLDEVHPRTRVPLVLEEPTTDLDVDAAVVAYPHGASAPVVAELLERGIRVVDLSAPTSACATCRPTSSGTASTRRPSSSTRRCTGCRSATASEIRDARLVANPGCYPTAAILALAPLAGRLADVVIDAKSGVSGAGREPTHTKHFVTVDETVTPYKVGAHRHSPEIAQELGVPVTFTPHLVPLSHGELVSCYVRTDGDVDARALYRDAYADEPWVEVVEGPPGMTEVRETNFCRISLHEDPLRLIVFATIDNLYKGTSSQAVQNLNLMFGLDESLGLPA